MSHVGRTAWKRFVALGLAGALAIAGLWLLRDWMSDHMASQSRG
jgi:hypothetical protein